MKRIEYLDAMKGLAIILMIMGHAIAWNYGDFKEIVVLAADQPTNVKWGGGIWQLIYSFHMALFFMISGFLSYKESGVDKVGNYVIKKTKRLLVPWIFTFGIIFFARGSMGYWFLLSLFEIALVGYIYLALLQLFNSHSFIIDALIAAFFYWALRFITGACIFDVRLDIFTNYWMPFCFGILMHKYNWLYKMCCNNELFFTTNFLVFVITFISRYIHSSMFFVEINRFSNYYLAISGCLIVWRIFANMKNEKIQNRLSFLGKKTMPIYILHIFFVIQIPAVGHFILNQNPVTSVTLQLSYSLLITCITVFWSLIVYKCLKNSRILSAVLFGEYEEK